MAAVLELVSTRPVVVVSPHLDDGVLSAFALLAGAPEVRLVTVFTDAACDGTASEWDASLGFGSSTEAMQARLAEDRVAADIVGVVTGHLGLREVAYRTGDDEVDVRCRLRSALESMLDEQPDVVLAIPGAMGRPSSRLRRLRRSVGERWPLPGLRMRPGEDPHRDHRLVHDVALDVALGRRATVIVYEDLPYAYAGGGAHLRALAQRSDLRVARERVPIDLASKERAVRAYASQCRTLLPTWSDDFADGFDPVEHYWTVIPAPPA